MMISGNHDSAPRVNCFRKVLSGQNIYMVGQPPRTEEEYIEKVILEDKDGKVNFLPPSVCEPSMVKQVVGVDENGNNLSYNETLHRLIGREKINSDERNVFVSHQFYLPSGKNAEDVERMDPRCVRSEILMRYLRMCWEILIMQHSDTSTNQ